jgi:hypothetical protein
MASMHRDMPYINFRTKLTNIRKVEAGVLAVCVLVQYFFVLAKQQEPT